MSIKINKKNLRKEMGICPIKSKEGIWVPMLEDSDEAVKLRYAVNTDFVSIVEKEVIKYRKDSKKKELDNDEIIRLQGIGLAKAVIADWKGFVDEDGAPVPYTPETFIENIVNDPELFMVIKALLQICTNTARYRVGDEDEEDEDTPTEPEKDQLGEQ